MKKRKNKFSILMMLLICLLSVNVVFAATNDGQFTASTNRQYYTPVSCDIQIKGTNVYFSLMQWEDRMFGAALYWEGELRGYDGDNPVSGAYSDVTACTGNLPNLYKEYDEDDLSVGCWSMQDLDSTEYYYAGLTTTKGSSYDDGVKLVFESETGTWLGLDGLPSRYQTFATPLNTATRTAIAWMS